MPHHRFRIGQTVIAHAPGIPLGPYVIARLMPLVGDEPHYQAKSQDGIVRALLESQIKDFTRRKVTDQRNCFGDGSRRPIDTPHTPNRSTTQATRGRSKAGIVDKAR